MAVALGSVAGEFLVLSGNAPETLLAIAGGATVVGGAGGYAIHSMLRGRGGDAEPEEFVGLRETLTSLQQVALVVPDNPGIDSLAGAVGLQALCKEWGVPANVFTPDDVTSEDAKAFCNLFDAAPTPIEEAGDALSEADGAIAVGGGGTVSSFGNNPPVVAVVRHRPVADDYPLVVTRSDDGATSTTVARLLERADVVPEQRVATALLYGIRAGTREFRRVRGQNDYEAAGFLHDYADHGRIEALRAPGMSSETFDVIGEAIANRERRASFAVTNVGTVPAISALEEASDTLLRLDGVSSAAVFGVHEGSVVASCRAEDVRTNALEILEIAFDDGETIAGNTDVATARVPLGLFSKIDGDHQATLDELIDASTRKALFKSFERM